MIRALSIDDEVAGREDLKEALTQYCPEVELIASFDNPGDGLSGIQSLSPDLVFLDVQMPGMSGFDVLQKLSPVSFEVIFVSAYDRYAIKAIKFSALDYLLKPVDIDELMKAVGRARERLERKQANYPLQSVLHNIQQRPGQVERIAVPSAEGIDFFETREIIYCKADDCYTEIYLANGDRKVVSRTLKDFESLLIESRFCRVHHSYLINLSHVKRYIKGEGGYVILSGDHHVDVSRRKKEEFMAQLNKL